MDQSIQIENLKQVSLRYINKFPKTQSPLDVLNISYPFPKNDISKMKGIQISTTEEENDNTYISINIIYSSVNSDVILDINGVYLDTMQKKIKWDLDTIMTWTDNTHTLIYEHFESLVTEKEKEIRK